MGRTGNKRRDEDPAGSAPRPGQPGQPGQPGAQPAPDAASGRYKGCPLLVLMEYYILDTIGQLAPDKQSGARAATKRAYGGGDDWRATLRDALQFHADDGIRKAWASLRQRGVDAPYRARFRSTSSAS